MRLFQLSSFKLTSSVHASVGLQQCSFWGESPAPPCRALQLLQGFLVGSWRGAVPLALSGKEKSQSAQSLQEG